MAIGFVQTKVAGRSSGKNALAMAAYRSGEKLTDERTGISYDYTKKSGVDKSIILAPINVASDHWLMDRQQLWNQVEANEKRYDAQVAREMIIAIPRELNQEDKINLVCEHVRSSYVERGMVADICYHELDSDNPHAHVMMTMRNLCIDPEGKIDFGNKNRNWNDKKLLKTQRLEWDKLANVYLERAGIADRIDTRSYEERGIDRLSQIHLGVAVASMRERGIQTERGDLYDRIQTINANIAQAFEDIYNSSPVERDENEIVNSPLEITPLEIEKIRIVTPPLEVTPPNSERNERDNLAKGLPLQISRIKKWQPIRQQLRSEETVASLEHLYERLEQPDSIELGYFRVDFFEDRLEVCYQDDLVMVIDRDNCYSTEIDPHCSINQYNSGLDRDIFKRERELDIERKQEKEREKECEPEREREREQEIIKQQELSREHDFGEYIEYDFGEPEQPTLERYRTRERDIGWSR